MVSTMWQRIIRISLASSLPLEDLAGIFDLKATREVSVVLAVASPAVSKDVQLIASLDVKYWLPWMCCTVSSGYEILFHLMCNTGSLDLLDV